MEDEIISAAKRMVLEAENLIERLEEDTDCNLRWISEKDSLLECIEEARELLWPKTKEQSHEY